jgi:hypothetical protein
MDDLAFEIDKLESEILAMCDEVEFYQEIESIAMLRLKVKIESKRGDLKRLKAQLEETHPIIGCGLCS